LITFNLFIYLFSKNTNEIIYTITNTEEQISSIATLESHGFGMGWTQPLGDKACIIDVLPIKKCHNIKYCKCDVFRKFINIIIVEYKSGLFTLIDSILNFESIYIDCLEFWVLITYNIYT
ncbi:hypothetical protein C0J52_01862, partial [Blattella germanica]